MPRTPLVVSALPFLPVLAGLVLCTWRFRAHDPIGGLAFGITGLLGMVVVIFRLPDPDGR